jgi:hypothetical protein
MLASWWRTQISLSLSLSLHLCGELDKLLNLVFFETDSRERAAKLLVGQLMDAFEGKEEKVTNNTLCKRKIGSVREGEEEETREGVWLFRYANANASKQDKWGCPILLLLVQNAFSPLIKLLTITGLTQV